MTPADARIREVLVDRQARLVDLVHSRPEPRLVDLLRRVDTAIARIESPEWSVCRVCDATIPPPEREAYPGLTVCLECLADDERQALERDLGRAAATQRRLLPPDALVHPEWEIAWRWEPRGAVSGDYVDLVTGPHRDDPVHLLLGDVVGKGIAAAFLQAHLHALFRALASPSTELPALLERANALFCSATRSADYATLVAARLHPDGRVELANAGHPRPLLADARGVRPIEGGELPLGLFDATAYTTRTVRLAPGDTLLLYTDGLTETEAAGEEYGVGRAAAALARASRLEPGALIAACREDLDRFAGTGSRDDDLTLVAVRRRGPS